MARILVVEDNLELAAGIRYNLELEGHEAVMAEDGPAGLAAIRGGAPELIILDVSLPGMDGFQVLRLVREDGIRTPVIMLTARGAEEDKVRAFRLDADQYVTKPFGLMELLERVSSLLRRARSWEAAAHVPEEPMVRFGAVTVDPMSRKVIRDGREVVLTPRAWNLLIALIKSGGRVATRQDLLETVWGHRGRVLTRTVDSHISELRQKLELDPEHPRHILTVWKVGYRFEA